MQWLWSFAALQALCCDVRWPLPIDIRWSLEVQAFGWSVRSGFWNGKALCDQCVTVVWVGMMSICWMPWHNHLQWALHCFQMEWCKMKTKGISPSPRSGHAGLLIGDKWYIAGGETRGLGELVAWIIFQLIWNPALISVISPHKRLFVLLCMLCRLGRDINAWRRQLNLVLCCCNFSKHTCCQSGRQIMLVVLNHGSLFPSWYRSCP